VFRPSVERGVATKKPEAGLHRPASGTTIYCKLGDSFKNCLTLSSWSDKLPFGPGDHRLGCKAVVPGILAIRSG